MLTESHDIRCILNPTDFSQRSIDAFAHALRIAVANRSALHVLHVEGPLEHQGDMRFPRVRELLAQWGIIPHGADRADIKTRTGVEVRKTVIDAFNIGGAIGAYARRHACDVLVMTTHDASALRRWTGGSASEEAAQASRAPALFLRDGDAGFIDRTSGAASLHRILLPIDGVIPAADAQRLATHLARSLGMDAQIIALHVGSAFPADAGRPNELVLRDGPVVETIVSFAQEIAADLIVMPTEGRHGVIEAFFGGTTARVLHAAPCPVLAVPRQ